MLFEKSQVQFFSRIPSSKKKLLAGEFQPFPTLAQRYLTICHVATLTKTEKESEERVSVKEKETRRISGYVHKIAVSGW
jgi:hypothetical protein